MAHALNAKQSALIVAGGVAAAWIWVSLFSFWAIYDTPLVKFGLSLGLGVQTVARLSLSLFALITAIVFTLTLRIFSGRSFLPAAIVFIIAFLATFIVPAVFDSGAVALLTSLSSLWVFVMLFALCVTVLVLTRHAQPGAQHGRLDR